MINLWQDVRYASRKLLKSRGFSAVALLTLALGIGAATAIFSVVDTALLRPLPFVNPDRLSMIVGVAGPEHDVRLASYPEIRDWRSMTRSFSSMSIYSQTTFNLGGTGGAELLQGEFVSPGYFHLLGVSPELGRGLSAEDDIPGATPAVVISHGLWQRRFGGASNVLGRTVRLDDRPCVIVGVMPEGFGGLSFDAQVWAPLLPFMPDRANARGGRWLWAIGRLAPGVSKEAAQADLRQAARQLAAVYPNTNRDRSAVLVSLHRYYLGATRALLLAILAAVGFLLLIACVNVINLQIMRGIGRRGEIALRYALGADRTRLVAQLTTEGLVLVLLGGIAGIGLAWLGVGSLVALLPRGVLPAYVHVSVNGRVLLFAAVVVGLTGVSCGIAPGLRTTRRAPMSDLRAPDRSAAAATAGSGALQRTLVVVEVALAVALMGSAALMVRSLTEQLAVAPGFRPHNALIARVNLDADKYSPAERVRLARGLIESLESTAGVGSVAVGSDAPLRGGYSAAILNVQGRPASIRYYRHRVTPAYFRTLGIAMIRGRTFEAADDADAPRVAIVSESFAKKIWPGLDPIGRTFRIGRSDVQTTVVGVATDVRFRDLTSDLMDPREDPDVYFPFAQLPTESFEVIVRSATSRLTDIGVVRRALAKLDSSATLARAQSLDAVLAAQTAGARAGSAILGLFAALALVLSSVGLYGVMAFLVASRRREIAIRIAMGADPARVLRMVISQGMLLVGIGAAAGLAGVLLAGRVLSSVLFEVGAFDPAVYFSTVTLALVALLACAVPARRATRINPTEALRHE